MNVNLLIVEWLCKGTSHPDIEDDHSEYNPDQGVDNFSCFGMFSTNEKSLYQEKRKKKGKYCSSEQCEGEFASEAYATYCGKAAEKQRYFK